MGFAPRAAFAFLAFLLLFPHVLHADEAGDRLARFDDALDAKVSVEERPFLMSPQEILISTIIKNKQAVPMSIYVIRQKEGSWEVVRLLGAIAPSSAASYEIAIQAKYDKQVVKKTKYAIVGRGDDGKTYGNYFEVSEDWSAYEQGVRDNLSDYLVSYVPIIALLMIVLIIITAEIAYSSKSEGEYSGEYTLKTLIFPDIAGRSGGEKIADVLINPIFILFEIIFIGLLAFVMYGNIAENVGANDAAKIIVLAGIGAFVVPFLYFAASWLIERREESKPLRFFSGMFAWGMFAAFLSLVISSTILSNIPDSGAVSFVLIATMLIAPVVEETVKGLGVFFVSGHHGYNDTLTGLLLGFTCGAGFAFVENWFYFAYRSNPFEIGLATWGGLIIYRSFLNTLAHGFFTAAISTAVGYCKGIDRLRPFAKLAFIPGLFIAISIHIIYNLSAVADSFAFAGNEVPFFIFNPMMIILLATLFFLVLVFALIDEKKRKAVAKKDREESFSRQ